MRALLRSAGFHRQPLPGLLQGHLYLEVWKSGSAYGNELEITFRSGCYIFVLSFALFIEGQKIFLCPALSVPTGHSHSILRHRPRKSSTCATLPRAYFYSEGWDCL